VTAAALPVLPGTIEERSAVVTAACRLLGRALAHALFRIDVQGGEHVPSAGPVLVAGNHRGFLDGPLVFLLLPRPTAVLAKSEIFVGVWTRLWRRLDVIPVRRGAPDRAALRAGLHALQRGSALTVFPEGTRGQGRLESVTDGLAWLALRSGARVVPVSITGTDEAVPRGTWRPRLRSQVVLRFGAPFAVEVPGDPRARSTVRAAAERIRAGLLEHVDAGAAQR